MLTPRLISYSIALVLAGSLPSIAQTLPSMPESEREKSPWGITTSASSTRTVAEWMPKMSEAGVRWARMFLEWSGIEKPKGTFHFEGADKLVAAAEANNVEISGLVFGNAPWAKGGFHAFPMNNLEDWTEYARTIADHYKGRIHYWEVWNEGNGGFNDGHNVTADYAKMLAAAYAGVKKGDPEAKVGIDVASFDAAYIGQVIRDLATAGMPGSFDYLCIHPYETFGLIGDVDGEVPYLWMMRMLRDELKALAPAGKADAPVWITEIGRPINRKTNEVGIALGQDVHEMDAGKTVVKAYVMAAAQGIARVCWFEARDPVGEPPGYGLLKGDNSPRVSWLALKTTTAALGIKPEFQGWLTLGKGNRSYGFVFRNGEKSALALWMPARMTDNSLTFNGDVQVIDSLTGVSTPLKTGEPLTLTDKPVFITDLPAELVAQAQANAKKNFPWGGDYSGAATVSLQLGAEDIRGGVVQSGAIGAPHVFEDDHSTGRVVQGKIGSTANFYTHPSFAGIMAREYYIRIAFRRLTPGNVGMNFKYEVADSQGKGPLRHSGGWFSLKPGMEWQTQTWHVTDACFAKMWSFDFCVAPEQSVPFVIGKVEVSTKPFAN